MWILYAIYISVSRGIVNVHGGSTGLFSAGEGQGSNFFFSLPIYMSTPDENDTEEGDNSIHAKCIMMSSKDDELEAQAKPVAEALEDKLKVFSGLHVLVVILSAFLLMF
jgi:hypothetical protein